MIPCDFIKRILDGDGILITGAGASFGAINQLGNPFPNSKKLAEDLYKECGQQTIDDDLNYAASKYLKTHGPLKLISFLQLTLGVKEIKDWHRVLFTLPWRRCYTTNYDNIGIWTKDSSSYNVRFSTVDDARSVSTGFHQWISRKLNRENPE